MVLLGTDWHKNTVNTVNFATGRKKILPHRFGGESVVIGGKLNHICLYRSRYISFSWAEGNKNDFAPRPQFLHRVQRLAVFSRFFDDFWVFELKRVWYGHGMLGHFDSFWEKNNGMLNHFGRLPAM